MTILWSRYRQQISLWSVYLKIDSTNCFVEWLDSAKRERCGSCLAASTANHKAYRYVPFWA